MPRLDPGKISLYKRRYYRLSKGKFLKDGKLVEAMFSLGTDYATAKVRCDAITEVWEFPGKDGARHGDKPYWTPAMLDRVERDVAQIAEIGRAMRLVARSQIEEGENLNAIADSIGKNENEPTPEASGASAGSSTEPVAVALFDALDAFATARNDEPTGKQYKRRVTQSVATVKRYLKNIGIDASVAITTVDRGVLERLTSYIKSRPMSLRKNKVSKRYGPIAAHTVKTLLHHLGQAVSWMDAQADSDRFGRWEAPRRWERLFSLNMNQLRSKAERDAVADGPVQVEVEEIKALYAEANDFQKMLLLMGLFTAQGQKELSVARRTEFDLAQSVFTHRRNKTGQQGRYWLPPELVKLIRAYWKKHPKDPEGLAFRTRQGRSLVDDTAQSDSVVQFFNELRSACAVVKPSTSFYSLRRYFGHRAMIQGGAALRDAALSHSAKEVGDKHYSNHRDYAGVEKVGRMIHAELTKVGMFSGEADGIPRKNKSLKPTEKKGAKPVKRTLANH